MLFTLQYVVLEVFPQRGKCLILNNRLALSFSCWSPNMSFPVTSLFWMLLVGTWVSIFCRLLPSLMAHQHGESMAAQRLRRSYDLALGGDSSSVTSPGSPVPRVATPPLPPFLPLIPLFPLFPPVTHCFPVSSRPRSPGLPQDLPTCETDVRRAWDRAEAEKLHLLCKRNTLSKLRIFALFALYLMSQLWQKPGSLSQWELFICFVTRNGALDITEIANTKGTKELQQRMADKQNVQEGNLTPVHTWEGNLWRIAAIWGRASVK